MQIHKNDLVAQVYERLKQDILAGTLAPATPLRQEELAASLGVSRQPISHAMVLLEHEGLVTEIGRKGKMVTPVEPHQLLNLYQVRAELDGLAAELCAQRPNTKMAEDLNSLITQGEIAQSNGSISALVEADIAFHRALYDHSGNPEIAKMADNSWSHVVRAMHQVLKDQNLRADIWNDHRQIAHAIISGDAQQARHLASNHANSSGQITYSRLTQSNKD